METNWAADNLQTIRTLMERSAVYRRALAPIMISIGLLGISAALAGWGGDLASDRAFVALWLGAGLAGIVFAFWQSRRQALKESEPFWTPPVRRIVVAVAPAWFVGICLAALTFHGNGTSQAAQLSLSALWMILYGISLNAAGFFMPRGIKLLGWLFTVSGCGFLVLVSVMFQLSQSLILSGHFAMGLLFGGLHLTHGIYLTLTEKRENAA